MAMVPRALKVDIDGMTCDGCVASVSRVLSRVRGANVVEVGVGWARVEIDEAQTDTQQIARAIEKAGFTVRGLGPTS